MIKSRLYSFFLSLISLSLQAGLQEELRALVESFDQRPSLGIEIVKRGESGPLLSHDSHKLFLPASNTKIITVAAALDHLGADFCFETVMGKDSQGNLFLKGGGDPSLTRAHLENMLEMLKQQGVTRVNDIILDVGEFDKQWYAPGTCTDDLGDKYLLPVSALSIDRACVRQGATELCPGNNVFSWKQLKQLVENAGIECRGEIKEGEGFPEDSTCIRHVSQPLSECIKPILQDSDNFYADCLFKKMGAFVYGKPATWGKGTQVVEDFMQENLHISPQIFVIKDGSGMSLYNRLTPCHLVGVLSLMNRHNAGSDFKKALPVSGVSGTLQKRLTEWQGKVRAKTGTVGGTTALSGYVAQEGGEEYIFSILVNDFGRKGWPNYKAEIEDKVCALLSRYQIP